MIKKEISSSGIYELALKIISKRKKFILDDDFSFDKNSDYRFLDSPIEENFLTKYLTEFGESAPHWCIPQANIRLLMKSNRSRTIRDGRLDFLINHPLIESNINIELDGDHELQSKSDKQRDDELKQSGIDVIRINNSEVKNKEGPSLDKLKALFKRSSKQSFTEKEERVAQSIVDTTYLTKLQFTFIRSIKNGWISPDGRLNIEVKGIGYMAVLAIKDILDLSLALQEIYGVNILPEKLIVVTDDGAYSIDNSLKILELNENIKEIDLRIDIQKFSSVTHEVLGESSEVKADFIVRPVYLDILFSNSDVFFDEKIKISSLTTKSLKPLVTKFLEYIFRKNSFREGQYEAIINTLQHNDSIVLLATGAGKSIIYQLSGLLMPGVTICISPLLALMDDQLQGLEAHGIDAAATINSTIPREESNELLDRLGKNEFKFLLVAPERFHNQNFREHIEIMGGTNIVNLIAIDEAHCVSEWGHEFRPAYLDLSNKIKPLMKHPPILALTGTASNSVLSDLFIELNIDPSNDKGLIKPDSLDRNELNFFIEKIEPGTWPPSYDLALKKIIMTLPLRFGMENAGINQFYSLDGSKTNSGIIFTRTRNETQTIKTFLKENFKKEGINDVFSVIHHGGLKDDLKTENAKLFKNNKVSLMIATKGYGMGIDKPNIRYTINYGIPSSIEAFYQQAGRAGRDRKLSFCGIIYCQSMKKNRDILTNPNTKVRNLNDMIKYKGKIPFKERGDLENQLFFHVKGFEGIANDRQWINEIINQIRDLKDEVKSEIIIPKKLIKVDQKGQQISKKGKKEFKQIDSDTAFNSVEKAITRLIRLGFIIDYTREGNPPRFIIRNTPFKLENCIKNFLEYVKKTRIEYLADYERKIAEHPWDDYDTKKQLGHISWFLLNFIYSAIEKQRRNALTEMVRVAESSTTDSEIRKRVLDYLLEGLGSEEIKNLLDQSEIDMTAWFDLINLPRSVSEYSQLRGSVARALSDGRDNPGLLLIRSLAEMYSADGDENTAVENLKASLISSFSDEKEFNFKNNDEWSRLLPKFNELIEKSDINIGKVISFSLFSVVTSGKTNKEFEENFKNEFKNTKNEGVSRVRKIFSLDNLRNDIEGIVDGVRDVANSKSIQKLIN